MAAALAWHEHATPAALAEALAGAVARTLDAAVAARGAALLVVSGGTTPVRLFQALSRKPLAWEKVTVTLADERCVAPDSERSNARLVAQHLLQNRAARAGFVPLCDDGAEPAAAAAAADRRLTGLAWPADVMLLGMGTDGHTASLFPGAEGLEAMFAERDGAAVWPVAAPGAGEPRLTLAPRLIAGARFKALHIEGADKKEALKATLARAAPPFLPVRRVLEMATGEVHIHWAPRKDSRA
ncbi:6-phosphogluconolactonase [Aquibium sp. A9E412]|uniref:6-phosphogluconolactonase n=1 Tax=Aquibium sp. A9E412 TaxID=2976767 RepID=UPI0025B23844|nr:6-phosphogluconolactonase [Aquibium sp. A9E412]MDN2565827.1 6-phosphogluconolactonase [Aquibium sp. A9E412]